jgi:hypothetical protein
MPWYGYGFGLGYGYGWGAWGMYPPAFYQPEGGVDMNVAMMNGYGAVDLEVKPNRAEVWVDGRYVGEARDLDGYPSFLWLPAGEHRVAVYKGGFKTFDEPIGVQRGMRTEVKLRMLEGESGPPPGTKPPADEGRPSKKDGQEKQQKEPEKAPEKDKATLGVI